jgi:xylulokinase
MTCSSPEPVVLAVDVGTTSTKVCAYRVGTTFELAASAVQEYDVHFTSDGGAEQDPEDWWRAVCLGTRSVVAQLGERGAAGSVSGMAFCCQAQSLVLVDESGRAVRPAMNYMDQRAVDMKRRGIERGLRLAGLDLRKLVPSLIITGAVSASVKDPVWKYQWVREREPGCFTKARWWLDVKEFLVGRATGRFAMTHDTANQTFLYDTRPGHLGWSPILCDLFQVERRHLPEVIGAWELAGPLLKEAANELGVERGLPVFGGGGDVALVALGSGAVEPHTAHFYMGTSGWVAASVERRHLDMKARAGSILGAIPGRYNYVSEQETAGKCMQWVRDHLALDSIGLYLGAHHACEDPEARYENLFDFLDETIESAPAGSGGVIFTPWLHGSRSPFEDPNARGMFFNIGLETGKRCLVRSVAEGLALQCRWHYDTIRSKVALRGALRFVGGGALSRNLPHMIADATRQIVEVPQHPQNAGALGAAIVCAVGLGLVPSAEQAAGLVPIERCIEPSPEHEETYERHYAVLKRLYRSNRQNFAALHGATRSRNGAAAQGEGFVCEGASTAGRWSQATSRD